MIHLIPTPDALRWRLEITDPICAGSTNSPFLFGGSALAALIGAMSRTCGRPPVWATAQYLSYLTPGVTADISVSILAAGKQITQAKAALSVEGREIVTALGAFGSRDIDAKGSWITAPKVAPPDQCPRVIHRSAYRHGVETTMDIRLAQGRYAVPGQEFAGDSDGRMQLWIRAADPQPVTAELLAIMGDFISSGSNHALARYCTGNSLDNTMRFIAMEETDWVLCDIHIEAIANGFIHGSMYMFSESGVLMAIASTSLILRLPDFAE